MPIAIARHGAFSSGPYDNEEHLLELLADTGFTYEIREQRKPVPGGVAVRRVLWNVDTDRWDGDIVAITQ